MKFHKKLLLLILCSLLCSCSLADPLSRAQDFKRQGKITKAIELLEDEYLKDPKSVPVKSLLAQMYSDYGIELCRNTEMLPKEKYPLAKKQFARAIELNPYLVEAKDMYDTIEKIQEAFKQSEKTDST